MARSLKFTPPVAHPMGGIRMSDTSELTIALNAAPMISPTAMSTTFPRMMNALNSLTSPIESVSGHTPRPCWEVWARPVEAVSNETCIR